MRAFSSPTALHVSFPESQRKAAAEENQNRQGKMKRLSLPDIGSRMVP